MLHARRKHVQDVPRGTWTRLKIHRGAPPAAAWRKTRQPPPVRAAHRPQRGRSSAKSTYAACDAETRAGHGARYLHEAEGPPGRAARRSAAPAALPAARTGPRRRRAPARADLSINLEELCTPPPFFDPVWKSIGPTGTGPTGNLEKCF